MATGLDRGTGSEIIRCHHFKNVGADHDRKIIIGERYHIYTVLSVVVYCVAIETAGNLFRMYINGYDLNGLASNQNMIIYKQPMTTGDTIAFNEKFSFNGHEPDHSSMSSTFDTVAEQNHVADQESTVAQYLWAEPAASADDIDIHISFIDQNIGAA